MTEPVVYDCSYGPYVPGVNNFTLDNAYAALRAAKIIQRRGLKVMVDIAIYDELDCSNQLDHIGDRTIWRGMDVTINPDNDLTNVAKAVFTDNEGRQAILITKEGPQ